MVVRHVRKTIIHRFAALVIAMSTGVAIAGESSDLLYVWAWDRDKQDSDFLSVLDVDPDSPSYGEVLNSIPVGVIGGAHHIEHQIVDPVRLVTNSFTAGKSFVFDLSQPSAPKIAASFSNAGPFSYPHSFERLANGHVLATFQRSAANPDLPGGLVELDDDGKFVRGSFAADSIDPELMSYSLSVVPNIDRVVTTTSDMEGDRIARSIQIWRMSDLKLMHTILLPEGPRGDEHLYPGEARVLQDGKSVMVVTWKCGMYLVEDIDSDPKVEFLRSFPWSAVEGEDTDCNIPVQYGNYWVQTIGTTGSLAVLDLTNPREPRIVSEYSFGIDARPHWISIEPEGSRIVLTGGGSLNDNVILMHLDPDTGELSLIDNFRSPGNNGFGVSFDRASWPHGDTGAAVAHGAVFQRKSESRRVASAKSVDDFKSEALAVVDAYTVQESIELVGDDSVVFVDVREGDELVEHGKIEGAVHVPRGVLEFYIDPKSSLHMDIFSSGKKLIFYCASGGRSMLAAKLALDMGVPDAVYLEGGFRAWAEADGETSP